MKIRIMDDDGNEVEVDVPDTISITFKTPDCIWNAVREMTPEGISAEDLAAIIQEDLEPWISYGEILTVRFNLKEKTATVAKQ
jgi:hypothetical protein